MISSADVQNCDRTLQWTRTLSAAFIITCGTSLEKMIRGHFFSSSGWNKISITGCLINPGTTFILPLSCCCPNMDTWAELCHTLHGWFLLQSSDGSRGRIWSLLLFSSLLVSFWTISFITVELPHLQLQYSYFRYQQGVFLMNECGYAIKIRALVSSFHFNH